MDNSASFTLGQTRVNAFATSGADAAGTATTGQADAHSVSVTAQTMTSAGIGQLMNMLHAQAAGDINGSTGIVTAISSQQAGRFTVACGARGDSQTLLIMLDAQGRVLSVVNPQDQAASNGPNEFGIMGMLDNNALYQGEFDTRGGKKLVAVSFSDGVTDAFLKTSATQAWHNIAQDIAHAYQQQGMQADLSTMLAQAAYQRGSDDNITVVASVLDEHSTLRNGSIVIGVFDGVGKTDGALSGMLAQATHTALAGTLDFDAASQHQHAHISTRVQRGLAATSPQQAASSFMQQNAAPPSQTPLHHTRPRPPAA